MDTRKQARHIVNQFLNNVDVSVLEAAYLTLLLMFKRHFREKLLLYLLWRDEKKDLKNYVETFEDHYNSKRLFIVDKQNKYEFNAELMQQAKNAVHLEYSDEYDELAPDAQQQ